MVRLRWLLAAAMVFGTTWIAVPAGYSQEAAPEKAAEAKEGEKKEGSEKPSLAVGDRDLELFRLFVDTLDQVERNYVKPIDRRELMEAAIRGVVKELDPYSNYIAPEEVDRFRDSLESQFGGIGIQVTMDEGQLKVLSPLVGTPAYRAGIHPGDKIVEIEGKSTEGVALDEAVRRLKGAVGTSVKVRIEKAFSKEARDVVLTRETIRVETVLGEKRKEDDRWNYMLDDERKIGYIRVTTFSRETLKELTDALDELKEAGAKGLILDLRFNPGGLLNAAIEICDLFVPKGVIVSTKGRNIDERVWEAHTGGLFEEVPMVVLINRYSASASEIVSACLQDHKRAIVVGERSWGKGSVQNVIELEGGKSVLKLTTASYWRPSGKNIHRFPNAPETEEWGVKPDDNYEIKLSSDELRDLIDVRRRKDLLTWTEDDAKNEGTKKPEGTAESSKKPVAGRNQGKDRQLERALEYLSTTLAKANEATPAAESR